MWRSLLILVTIVLTLGTNISSASAEEETRWIPPPPKRSPASSVCVGLGFTVFGLGYLPAASVGALGNLGNLFYMLDGRN